MTTKNVLLNVLYFVVGTALVISVAWAVAVAGVWMIKGMLVGLVLLICWAVGKTVMGEAW